MKPNHRLDQTQSYNITLTFLKNPPPSQDLGPFLRTLKRKSDKISQKVGNGFVKNREYFYLPPFFSIVLDVQLASRFKFKSFISTQFYIGILVPSPNAKILLCFQLYQKVITPPARRSLDKKYSTTNTPTQVTHQLQPHHYGRCGFHMAPLGRSPAILNSFTPSGPI